MNKRNASVQKASDSEPGPRLRRVNQYLEKNFPDFFAEARFQVGDDDYFLYSRFGQYLARSIETNRPRAKISRGFTVLNKMARLSAKDPSVRHMMVSGPLEYIHDVPKARELARKRLSPVAQGYLESLCEEAPLRSMPRRKCSITGSGSASSMRPPCRTACPSGSVTTTSNSAICSTCVTTRSASASVQSPRVPRSASWTTGPRARIACSR